MVAAYNTVSNVEKSTFAQLHRELDAAKKQAAEAEAETAKFTCLTCSSAPRAGFSLCGRSQCQNECLRCMCQAFTTSRPSCAYCKTEYKSKAQSVDQEMSRAVQEFAEGFVYAISDSDSDSE